MIETLIATVIVGRAIVGPNLVRTDYLQPDDTVLTVTETVQEVPNNLIDLN